MSHSRIVYLLFMNKVYEAFWEFRGFGKFFSEEI
jgi:hypothetical protein